MKYLKKFSTYWKDLEEGNRPLLTDVFIGWMLLNIFIISILVVYYSGI